MDDTTALVTPVEFNAYDAFTVDAVGRHSLCNLAETKVERGQSYWNARGAKDAATTSKNVFEKLADEIFDFHTLHLKGGSDFDPATSGTEWWMQVRDCSDPEDASIGFHWDEDYIDDTKKEVPSDANSADAAGYPAGEGKADDENQANATSSSAKKTPYLATVTYLNGRGAPTVVMTCPPFQAQEAERELESGFVSFPRVGKHIAFRGSYLHGVPSELKIEAPKEAAAESSDGAARSKRANAARSAVLKKLGKLPAEETADSTKDSPGEFSSKRVTFLVNLWLNSGAPTGAEPFDNEKHKVVCDKPEDSAVGAIESDDAAKLKFAPTLLEVAKLTTGRRTPVRGFAFEEPKFKYELWLPIPKMSADSVHLTFKGGEEAPCFCSREAIKKKQKPKTKKAKPK